MKAPFSDLSYFVLDHQLLCVIVFILDFVYDRALRSNYIFYELTIRASRREEKRTWDTRREHETIDKKKSLIPSLWCWRVWKTRAFRLATWVKKQRAENVPDATTVICHMHSYSVTRSPRRIICARRVLLRFSINCIRPQTRNLLLIYRRKMKVVFCIIRMISLPASSEFMYKCLSTNSIRKLCTTMQEKRRECAVQHHPSLTNCQKCL